MTEIREWQPIETLPKGHKEIFVTDCYFVGSGEVADGVVWINGCLYPDATHWMPLPDPPISTNTST